MSRVESPSDQLRLMRVMIADDHEIVRHAVREILNTSGRFTVVAEASTSYEALELFKTNPVDLVLLDLVLHDGSALHVIREIRQRQNSAVIVFSATLSDETLLQTMAAGASGYITKDTPLADFIALLQRYKPGELIMTSSVMTRLVCLLIEQYLMLTQQNEVLNGHLRELTQVVENQETSSIEKAQDSHISTLPAHVLTPQEEKIFQLLRRGDSNKQIAVQLSISRFTVGKHVQNILRKLGAANRTQAVSYTTFEGENKQQKM